MVTRVLMCPPTALPALVGERSWQPAAPKLERARAVAQWQQLVDVVEANVAPVDPLVAEPWAWAMTFTRDLGIVVDDTVFALMPVSSRGPFEAPLFAKEMSQRNIELVNPDEPLRFDGGNVIADRHGRLLIGVARDAHRDLVHIGRDLAARTGRTAYAIPIAGGRFPHIDMALCELGERGWLVYPEALPGFDLTDPGWQAFFDGAPVIVADEVDGERLACNLVVAGDVAIGPEVSTDLVRRLTGIGIDYIATPLDELLKAGGGAHCLTLEMP